MKLKLATISLCLVFAGCAGPQNLYEFLIDTGFEAPPFIAIIRHDEKDRELKNFNAFVAAAKGAKKAEATGCYPRYELTLIQGSSSENQVMRVSLCNTGQGKAVRGGRWGKEFSFTSPEVYSLVESEIVKNKSIQELTNEQLFK